VVRTTEALVRTLRDVVRLVLQGRDRIPVWVVRATVEASGLQWYHADVYGTAEDMGYQVRDISTQAYPALRAFVRA
jgi:hypothetical protein